MKSIRALALASFTLACSRTAPPVAPVVSRDVSGARFHLPARKVARGSLPNSLPTPLVVTLSAANGPRVQWSEAERERNRPQADVWSRIRCVHRRWTGFAGGRFHVPSREGVRDWVFGFASG